MKISSVLVLASLFSSVSLLMSADAQGGVPPEGTNSIIVGPTVGGTRDVTGSNDAELQEVTEFVVTHLESANSDLHFVQYKAEMQVVAGLRYTIHFKGNDESGVCQEEHKVVVVDKPWLKERTIESDDVMECT